MQDPITITRVNLTTTPQLRATGLYGFLTFTINDAIEVSGVAYRQTREGEPCLSFPKREDQYGDEHFIIRPKNSETLSAIEDQVFKALGIFYESE